MKKEAFDRLGAKLVDILGNGPNDERTEAQKEAILRSWSSETGKDVSQATWNQSGTGEPRVGEALESHQDLGRRGSSIRHGILWLFRRHPAALATGGAGVAVVVLASVWLSMRTADTERLPSISGVTSQGSNIQQGQWLHGSQSRPLHLLFSEGSHVALATSSVLKVMRMDDHTLEFGLQNGQIDGDIKHRAGRRWIFLAGPYRVTVIGTRFRIWWRPRTEHLIVVVSRGAVRVDGGLSDKGSIVTSGHRLEADAQTQTVTLSLIEKAHTSMASSDLTSNRHPASPPRSLGSIPGQHIPLKGHNQGNSVTKERNEPLMTGRSATQTPVTRPVPWKQLMAKGQYRRAFEAVEKAGLSRVANSLDPWNLLRLADLARLTNRQKIARHLLVDLRRRYPRSGAASQAAFRLGRMAFHSNLHRAIKWFRIVLAEHPGTSLQTAAKGRIMEAFWRMGKIPEARTEAADYLKLAPQGAYATLARRILTTSPENRSVQKQ